MPTLKFFQYIPDSQNLVYYQTLCWKSKCYKNFELFLIIFSTEKVSNMFIFLNLRPGPASITRLNQTSISSFLRSIHKLNIYIHISLRMGNMLFFFKTLAFSVSSIEYFFTFPPTFFKYFFNCNIPYENMKTCSINIVFRLGVKID